MYLCLEATRDCPLSFDGNEVTRVNFKLPNNRKSDTDLSIKVFGDLLEHPSPVCIRQQVATISCQFYEDRDDCESQEAMYAYQSLNRDSSLLLCTLGLGIEDKIGAGAALLTRGITEMSARAFAKEFAEVLKPLSSTSDDELAQKTFVPVFTDASHSDSLDMENANACIRSIKRNLIPVLVGEAGCGKTYTAEHLGEKIRETFGKEGQVLKQTKICCSGIPYNEFWGSYDAVSHMCTGSFKYIWKEAENNSDILYYVILDEMLDMTDIRRTFGGAFADLDELPNNLFIVATGNNGVWEAGGVTYNKMLNDNGIDQNRFNLIPVHNIFEDLDSAEAQLYLSNFDKESERFKRIMEVATSDVSKVLSPRKFRNMMQLSDEEFKEDIEFGNKRDKHYEEKALLVDRPKYEK